MTCANCDFKVSCSGLTPVKLSGGGGEVGRAINPDGVWRGDGERL